MEDAWRMSSSIQSRIPLLSILDCPMFLIRITPSDEIISPVKSWQSDGEFIAVALTEIANNFNGVEWSLFVKTIKRYHSA